MVKPQPAPQENPRVWRALADPTRRAILDLLRLQPMTTGQLAERFESTRFGVMKHLGVLVEAGLVLVRREGRVRWNHLNPVPIQEIYHRWLRAFEAGPADRLLRLKQHVESQEESPMAANPAFKSLDIQLEVDIAAPPEQVWRSLTAGIGEWWPAKFYVGTTPKRFLVEPQVGGRVFEDWGDGEGAMFGTVTVFEPNKCLQWAGDMSAEYGGPARSVTTFRLAKGPHGNSTTLRFRDTPYGLLSDMALQGLQPGWTWLLTGCLKPWLESGTRPERPESVVA